MTLEERMEKLLVAAKRRAYCPRLLSISYPGDDADEVLEMYEKRPWTLRFVAAVTPDSIAEKIYQNLRAD